MTTTLSTHPIDAQKPITTVDELENHLHQAAALELSTIPLYLYAAYSIQTQGTYQWAAGMSAFRTIRSVVIEEMLHLCLVRNLLTAIGRGEHFRLYDESIIPVYPEPMLHRIPTLSLQLEPCTTDLMRDVFIPLELPAKTGAPAQSDQYNTIGQFYAAITLGFETLSSPALWKAPHAELQYNRAYWNQDGGGKPLVVTDLPSALGAITTIVEQGEGTDPHEDEVPMNPADPAFGFEELSHYAKFSRIAEGVDVIGDVWPVPTNPTRADYEGSVAALAELFDAAYCYVLCMIDAIYEASNADMEVGKPDARYGLERTFIAAMGGLLYPIADLLVRQPGPDGCNAAPTFGYYAFDDQSSKLDQLTACCDAVLGDYPELGGDDGVRQLIGRLPSV